MSFDSFSSQQPPDDRRGPFGGSAVLWKMVAIGLVVLAAFLIIPTLGQGPTNQPADDPFIDGPVVPTQAPATPPSEAPLTS